MPVMLSTDRLGAAHVRLAAPLRPVAAGPSAASTVCRRFARDILVGHQTARFIVFATLVF
jgi:hypothetical protein